MSHRIKSLLLVLTAFAVIASCQNSSKSTSDNSLTQDNLSGKVKRVLEVTYNGVNDRGTWRKDKPTQTYLVKSYDENGFKLNERSYYTDSNQLSWGFDYIYDEDQNLLKVESIDVQGNITGYSEVVNREGKVRILEYREFFMNGDSAINTGKTEMTWEGFKLQNATNYESQGELVSTNAYTYNDKGDLASFDINTKKPQERYVKMNAEYANFDEKGNWTVMFKQYESLPIKEFIERQIEYYED